MSTSSASHPDQHQQPLHEAEQVAGQVSSTGIGTTDSAEHTVGAEHNEPPAYSTLRLRSQAQQAIDDTSAAHLNASLRRRFATGNTRSLQWRKRQLEALVRLIDENEDTLAAALRKDLGKPAFESFISETSFVRSEAERARKNLKNWASEESVSTDYFALPGRSSIVREPLGVVLIIAPWNYPVQLSLVPVVSAIAAGNCVVLKPSEVASHVSAALSKLLPKYLDPASIVVVEGGAQVTTELLEQRWDHIFYTGNGRVGRIVMSAAAKHLTPVTLELGGKSPCVVDRTAKLDLTARRLLTGKFFNCGQTCIAPDYVLVERDVHDELIEQFRQYLKKFYGDDPQKSDSYGRLVNERHFDRVVRFLSSGRIVIGGHTSRSDRYIAPTVLADVKPDDAVMCEEIFGPVLPMIAVDSVEQAVEFINAREKPLASYIFSRDRRNQDYFIGHTSSGSTCVNHATIQALISKLPFGGVGESGMGAYHGKFGFETFSHRRAVLRKPSLPELPLVEPPYTDLQFKLLKKLI